MSKKMSINEVKAKSSLFLEIVQKHGVIGKEPLMEKARSIFRCKRRPYLERILNYLVRNGLVSIEGENVCFEDNKNQKISKEG